MKIIFGLGNPGEEYENTRHNVGFKVLDALNEKLGFDDFKKKRKFKGLFTQGEHNGEKIILVKPQTFMNLTGQSATKLIKFFKANLEDFWVVYDDLDFEVGIIKIKLKGSGGSHNGMSSVIKELGSSEFPRFRIGIDSRTEQQKQHMEGRDYVLSRFNKEDEPVIEKIVKLASEAIILAFDEKITKAMTKFNTK